jgi:hypothetical protein
MSHGPLRLSPDSGKSVRLVVLYSSPPWWGKASLSGVNIKNDIQMAPLAVPSMTVGDNRFTYVEHTDQRSGRSASRYVRITHTWVERSKTRPPRAPASPVYPAEGGKSDGMGIVFQWKAATDPDRLPTRD